METTMTSIKLSWNIGLRGGRPALLLLFVMALAAPVHLRALPRFSLLTGTRCSACHFNPQGSGIRNELGWSTMNEIGAIQPSMIGLDSLFAAESNTFWKGLVTVGLDARVQYADFGAQTGSEIKVMQLSPAIAIQPLDELTVYGSFNFADKKYLGDKLAVQAYQGQSSFDLAVQYQPGITLPSIRVGHIQPSVGIRQDDHTMFVRQETTEFGTLPILPPNYNEWGAELTYEGTRDFTVNAGVYSAKNLGQNFDVGVDSAKPSFSGRLIYWPQLLDEGLNGMVGGSLLANGEFTMINAFAGIGLSDRAALYGEGMFTHTGTGYKLGTTMIYGTYQLTPWMSLEGRYERGTSKETAESPVVDANSYVIGSQFFVFPYFEIRPEYRYRKTAVSSSGQFALQVHLFY
ncbi:MAG: hypothetical protein ABIR47_13075 [Candidatus Kapaibacterium sp.]